MFLAVRYGGPAQPLEPFVELDAMEALQQPRGEIPGRPNLPGNISTGLCITAFAQLCTDVFALYFEIALGDHS